MSRSRGDLWGNALRFPVELDDLQTLPATSCGRNGGGGGRWRRERGCVLAVQHSEKQMCKCCGCELSRDYDRVCNQCRCPVCASCWQDYCTPFQLPQGVQLFSAKRHIVSWLITCRIPKSSYRAPNSAHSNKFYSKTIVFDHVFLHHF